MEKLTPTLHREIPMGTRVVVPAGYAALGPLLGRVVGIASLHVVFGYIVLLDLPIVTDYGETQAIVVYGALLEAEDGSNWRLSA